MCQNILKVIAMIRYVSSKIYSHKIIKCTTILYSLGHNLRINKKMFKVRNIFPFNQVTSNNDNKISSNQFYFYWLVGPSEGFSTV